uniref:Uncharacterized protein n=1 Tax=Panagrolaimus sp. JU765 TaxID=591449 RepID=A0AC34REV2_9BILA
MIKSDIEEFLRVCNDAIVQLMNKMEMEQPEMDNVSTKLQQRLIATLLEANILTAENYSNDAPSDRKDDDILERSNQTIKSLIQQLLDKDDEIKTLRSQLKMTFQ